MTDARYKGRFQGSQIFTMKSRKFVKFLLIKETFIFFMFFMVKSD